MMFHIIKIEVIYSKIGGGGLPPFPNPPATNFASQGDTHMRNDAQIKFLYYPLQVRKVGFWKDSLILKPILN